ncbi:MAG: phosphoethanolamine transferase [Rikenellaceae bacterium]|nr:phosphoethanolamine transferase [Rikenellaceae bacterium]
MNIKIKHFASKVATCILSPITQNPAFFICQLLIMIVPFAVYNFAIDYNYKGVIMEIIRILHIFIFDAYCLCVILLWLSKLINTNIVKTILYFITLILFVFDSFVAIFYASRISPVIIRLIRETNTDEISGFFTTLNSPNIVYLGFGIIAICTIITISEKLAKKYFSKSHNHSNISITSIGAGGCILLKIKYLITIIIAIICILNIIRNSLLSFAYINALQTTQLTTSRYNVVFKSAETANTTYGHLIHSLFSNHLFSKDIYILTEVLEKQYQTECSFRSSQIILIVGESFSKYHSNLYGYIHHTNRLLFNEVKNNNLFIFQDVITPRNFTSYVMQQIFTFKSQDTNLYWAETPLFTKFFKECGYIVSFFSNQEINDTNDDTLNASNHFLVVDQTSKYCITNTNLQKYKWDTDLVDEYKARIKHTANEAFLSIFHLSGQHFGYKDRYPNDEKLFTVDDYTYRTDLTQSQREVVAHYDNATAYNDKVVASIIDLYRNQDAIIIYLSDHGEEIHDYRNFTGREAAKLTPEICKYQFEIPFMIWMSDKYKENHPDVVKQVEGSLDKPFMIDDLPHLMLDIAGIDCEWFDPTRSLINEKYNVNRKRLLLDTKVDYDEMIKQLN